MADRGRRVTGTVVTVLGVSISLSSPLLAAPPSFPHQHWVCRPDADGQWVCRNEAAKPGRYPQAPLPKEFLGRGDPVASPYQSWDWVPAASLSEAQRCDLGDGCNGRYIEPPRDWPNAGKAPEQTALRASAETSQTRGPAVELAGEVELRQGYLSLDADKVILDRDRNRATVEGNVVIREPGVMLRGESAVVELDSGMGTVDNARVLHYDSGARGTAKVLSRTGEQVAELEDASYTQCPPDDESWRLNASHIRLNRDSGRGTAKHTVLRVGPVPVFYSPYLNFPIDDRRQTGFLWPTFGTSDEGGFDFSAPLYLNLAPNYDATIIPRHIEDRGTMGEVEMRYLNPVGEWRLSGGYLGNDDLTEEDRWLVAMKERGLYQGRWASYIDYTEVSDDDYFDDLDVASLEVRRQVHLNQAASVSYLGEGWTLSLLGQQYQTIDDNYPEPYKILPRLTLATRDSGASFKLDPSLLLEASVFDHSDAIEDGGNRVTGSRLYAQPGLGYPMHWTAGFLIPEVKVRYVGYDLDETANPADDDQPATTAPLASLDAGLFFERELAENRYLQTLEPRLFYVYSDFEEDQEQQPLFDTSRLTFNYGQLFRERRFNGYDRLEDLDQLSVGVTSRFQELDSGRELFMISVGQIFYFDDREVTLVNTQPLENTRSESPIAGQLSVQPNDNLWADGSFLWDARYDKIDEAGIAVHYQGDGHALYNLGYRFRRDQWFVAGEYRNLEQADASAVLPLTDRWRVFAGYSYDLTEHTSLEDLAGFEYEDCCWRVRILYRRGVDDGLILNGVQEYERDHAVLFEFQLKGLGGLGDKVAETLSESIYGYEEND